MREAPALPPEEEVKVHRNYHYAPCPSDIGNPALRITYLHSLFAPGGAHLQDFWLPRKPKKWRERIPEQPAVVGWGVYIGRRRNWRVWQVLSKLLIVLSLLFGVVYGSLKRDASSSFAVAQYAVAAMMMLLKVAELLQQQS